MASNELSSISIFRRDTSKPERASNWSTILRVVDWASKETKPNLYRSSLLSSGRRAKGCFVGNTKASSSLA